MIIRTLGGNNREIRSGWPDYSVPPRFPGSPPASSGEGVSAERTFGLPAFGAAVRLVAGVIAAARLDVYSGEGAKKRERPDAWQARLLDNPAEGMSQFDWLWDVASSLEIHQNAVLQKIKNGSRVTELRPIPMQYVAIYRDRNGDKVIEVNDGTRWRPLSPDMALHIRGATLGGGVAGVPKFTLHLDPIGSQLAAQRFEGAYFRNHARPDVAWIFPDSVSREQAEEWRPYIESLHGGAANFGKPWIGGGGVDIKPIPMNMRDAQFIEARELGVEDAARIIDVHSLLIGGGGQRLQGDSIRAATDVFMHMQMPPRLKRIAAALKADPDLFGITILYPEICVDELAFLDPLTRSEVEHMRIQDGTRLVDEVRADHGWQPLPPIPDDPSETPGMVPQLTPVGGQANPNLKGASSIGAPE